jgi:hypothetical protein
MGVMVRFSAGEDEITALLRFMTRKSRGGLRLVPLLTPRRDDLRLRRTTRPIARRITEDDGPTAWGLRLATSDAIAPPLRIKRLKESGNYIVDPEASRLVLFQLGPASGSERRREAVLEVRDPEDENGIPHPLNERDLIERCARRLRRRSQFENGRWIVTASSSDTPHE